MLNESHLNSASYKSVSSFIWPADQVDKFNLIAPWINTPPSGLWEPLLVRAAPMLAEAGEIILNAGDPAQGLYLLLRGRVKVIARTRSGLQRTILTIGAESVIGELALFSQKRQLNIIQALTDCEIYFFEPKMVMENIMTNSALAVWIFNNLALKIEATQAQLQETTFYSINTRVGRFIYLYALEHGQPDSVGGRWAAISHHELAERLGAHRVTITNAIQNFKRLGLLHTRPSRIIVPDMEAFKNYLLDLL